MEIVGNWISVDGRVQGDGACDRIRMLTEDSFEKLGTDSTGWETLYKDPTDGRLWERDARWRATDFTSVVNRTGQGKVSKGVW
jgi:hypothetical protein